MDFNYHNILSTRLTLNIWNYFDFSLLPCLSNKTAYRLKVTLMTWATRSALSKKVWKWLDEWNTCGIFFPREWIMRYEKLLPHNCYPSGWHRCPNPNCSARFWSKKKIYPSNSLSILCTAPILRILPFHAFAPQVGIKPGCYSWKLSAVTSTLRSLHQLIDKMS